MTTHLGTPITVLGVPSLFLSIFAFPIEHQHLAHHAALNQITTTTDELLDLCLDHDQRIIGLLCRNNFCLRIHSEKEFRKFALKITTKTRSDVYSVSIPNVVAVPITSSGPQSDRSIAARHQQQSVCVR